MSEETGGQHPARPAFAEMLRKWFAARAVSAEHAHLTRLCGDWNVTIRFLGAPDVDESHATATIRSTHGGRFIIEEMEGRIQAPDEHGSMRPEPYSATRILGHDNYRRAWVGAFAENQNTHLLSFQGPALAPPAPGSDIVLFGSADEPMMDVRDATMRYTLRIRSDDAFTWEIFALVVGQPVFEFRYDRAGQAVPIRQ